MSHRAALAALALISAPALASGPGFDPAPRNILLVIADDLGVDKVGVYAAEDHPDYAAEAADTLPSTPTIDGLAAAGVRFTQAWSNPACSPTRAALFTGRHALRNGVGEPVGGEDRPVLALEEVTFAEALGADTPFRAGYATGLFGKWHLGASADRPGELTDDAPREQGFDTYMGALNSALDSFYSYEKVVDGEWLEDTVTDYITQDTADDAAAWIAAQPEPWLATVAFQAPHEVYGGVFYEPPPTDCVGERVDPGDDDVLLFKALVECMDTELGALLDDIDPDVLNRTTIVFVGDNGTDGDVIDPAFTARGAKGSFYEGGLRVPLIIADGYHLGASSARRTRHLAGEVQLPGRTTDEPVHVADLFATFTEIAGVPNETGADSTSLVPLLSSRLAALERPMIYADSFSQQVIGGREMITGNVAVRSARYKLLMSTNWPADPCENDFSYAPRALYDLWDDPDEVTNLVEGGGTGSMDDQLWVDLFQGMVETHQSWVDETCDGAL